MACMIPTHTSPLNIFTETKVCEVLDWIDYDRTLLLLVGEAVLNVFLYTGMCAFFTYRM